MTWRTSKYGLPAGRRSGLAAGVGLALVALLLAAAPGWPAAGAQPVATATTTVSGPAAPSPGATAPPVPNGPVQPRGTRARAVAAGPGAVLTWGSNLNGELGDGTALSTSTAVPVQGLTGVVAISPGPTAGHVLAGRRDGTVVAWGNNANGQLGDNTTTDRNVPVRVAVLVPGDPAVAVAAGGSHSLALTASGAVWAWGLNDHGQLGDDSVTQRLTPVRVRAVSGAGNLTGIVAIAAGESHSLAVGSDGSVYGWGNNANGRLGDGTTADRQRPVQVITWSGNPLSLGVCSVPANGCAVAAGNAHSLGRVADGTLYAWGYNANGQLGNATNADQTRPVVVLAPAVSGPLSTSWIAAGSNHSLAALPDGSVAAWGLNSTGQLGDGSVTNRNRAVVVTSAPSTPLAGIATVAGGGSHSLALTTSGAVYAWGANAFGQLGDGSVGTNHTRAVSVLNLTGISALAAGLFHSVALGPDFPTPTVTPQPTATPYLYTPPATSAGNLYLISPIRILDTRAAPFGPIGFDGAGNPITATPFLDGDLRTYRLAGKTFQGFTVPAGIKGVVFTVTAAQAAPTGGFVTVFPGSAPLPAASTLNPSGATGATAVGGTTALDATGNLQIKSVGATRDIILDVTGYYQ